MATKPILHSLINASDSILLVIDVQDSFLGKLPKGVAGSLVDRIGFLMDVAGVLGIPVICTAEEIPVMGGMTAKLQDRLIPGLRVYDKMIFNLADQQDIMVEVNATGRNTAILTGLETDVCVAQSALGLMNAGYSVTAVADACGSPGDAHQTGLKRIKAAGGVLTSVKSLYYEWIRTVELANQFSTGEYSWIKKPNGMVF